MNIKYDVMVDPPHPPVPPGDGRDRSDVRVCPLKSACNVWLIVETPQTSAQLWIVSNRNFLMTVIHLTQRSFAGL